MKKISVFLRNHDVVLGYEKGTKRKFWDDLSERIMKAFNPSCSMHDQKGSLLHFFYFETEKTDDECAKILGDIVDELVSDKEKRGGVSLSVCDATEKELLKLKEQTAEKEEDKSFWNMADKLFGNTDADKSADRKVEPKADSTRMSGQAKRINELKKGLLSKIKGQRHAVEKVVQSIFECEVFASRNPDRKQPLATFLFTGPSGVGKSLLAETCGSIVGRKALMVDMSEYSDFYAHNEFGAVVSEMVRADPRAIIVFDEIEKAHMNTIHLFLQILDFARLRDHKRGTDVSFKDNIIIMTTNAGASLYSDPSVCDLSETPRSVILDALRNDINPLTRQPYFPECITTRMANGHVILFNRLEPFSLMEIVRDEIKRQVGFFEEAFGVKVTYDEDMLSALVMYNGGGLADARTLRGLARNVIVHELQEIIMQVYGSVNEKVDSLSEISVSINTEENEEVRALFVGNKSTRVALFTDRFTTVPSFTGKTGEVVITMTSDADEFKRRARGVVDYVLIDPLCGSVKGERVPNDIEDIDSDGMRIFNYMRESFADTPIYIMDTTLDDSRSFDTLLARGAKGTVKCASLDDKAFGEALADISFKALINNSVYSLGRSSKQLSYNCAQYILDEKHAVISFEKFKVRSAPNARDGAMMAKKGENNNLKFADLVGCKGAKATLREYCDMLDDQREALISGRRMPKGVLLYGPPGTGKTMLAKAMANECNASFFPISATTFFSSYVGETERNIRRIFEKARSYAPSIIFIDEVDAIGRRRTGSSTSTHIENALNAFLAEMDGFVHDEKRPVFILAATNYEIKGDEGRVLDAAFVRRFDSKIYIPLPDLEDRCELMSRMLKKHSIHFGAAHESVLENMAKRTGGMSNADLANLVEGFVRELGENEPDGAKFLDSLDGYLYGEVNKTSPDALKQTAIHEAGHALVCRLCGITPSFLTVVSRGKFGGYMQGDISENASSYTYDELMNLVCRCLAGRVAEIAVYGESKGVNTGASSDIKTARNIIKSCLDEYAMGEKLFANEDPADAETLMRAQYDRTKKMIEDNIGALERLAALLAEKKSLDKSRMEEFFKSENI